MAETDRLKEIKEIEDRIAKIGRPTPWWEPDLRWLIARVRELETRERELVEDRDMYAKMARGEIPVD